MLLIIVTSTWASEAFQAQTSRGAPVGLAFHVFGCSETISALMSQHAGGVFETLLYLSFFFFVPEKPFYCIPEAQQGVYVQYGENGTFLERVGHACTT